MNMFNVTMRHDDGTIVIATAASSPEAAARIVCIAEGAPARSVVSVEIVTGRAFGICAPSPIIVGVEE